MRACVCVRDRENPVAKDNRQTPIAHNIHPHPTNVPGNNTQRGAPRHLIQPRRLRRTNQRPVRLPQRRQPPPHAAGLVGEGVGVPLAENHPPLAPPLKAAAAAELAAVLRNDAVVVVGIGVVGVPLCYPSLR